MGSTTVIDEVGRVLRAQLKRRRLRRLTIETAVWLIIFGMLLGAYWWSMTAFVVMVSLFVASASAQVHVLLTYGPPDSWSRIS
jgi:hypothetical protein